MKRIFKITTTTFIALLLVFVGCKDEFLEKPAQGVLDPNVLADANGLNALLIAAYSELDGWAGWSAGAPWNSAGTNWVFGDVYADDAYKGTDVGDQPQINPIERYEHDAGNGYMRSKWLVTYDAVSRSNDVLRVLEVAVEKQTVDAALATQIEAEARFLRAYYHMEAIKMWDNVPYVDETVDDGLVPNPGIPYDEVEADFTFAYNNLPVDPRNGEVGRATKYAASGLLARLHLYQQDYSAAMPLLQEIVSSGEYQLVDNYHDNFRAVGDNNAEAIFQIQHSINDGAGGGDNGNYGDILNFPYTGGPGECCGFYQPSQNLVNAFKTMNGLPYLSAFGLNFNAVGDDVVNDQALASSDSFTEETRPLDPRLDWTVGRRGIPYLDWGEHPGRDWIRDQGYGGPYSPKKNVYYQSEEGVNSNAGGWGGGTTSNNYSILRYADVLLMLAECEVEVGSLDNARDLVNQVRARAADSNYWVKEADGVTNAANYVIDLYPDDGSALDAFDDQAEAREAVRFERRVEIGMEGHRFWDLKRWGVAQSVLQAYVDKESTNIVDGNGGNTPRTYLTGATFDSHRVRHPIPVEAIDRSQDESGAPTLTQNPGY